MFYSFNIPINLVGESSFKLHYSIHQEFRSYDALILFPNPYSNKSVVSLNKHFIKLLLHSCNFAPQFYLLLATTLFLPQKIFSFLNLISPCYLTHFSFFRDFLHTITTLFVIFWQLTIIKRWYYFVHSIYVCCQFIDRLTFFQRYLDF